MLQGLLKGVGPRWDAERQGRWRRLVRGMEKKGLLFNPLSASKNTWVPPRRRQAQNHQAKAQR